MRRNSHGILCGLQREWPMDKRTEFERFSKMTDDLLSVPHEELKRKLESEKKAKKRKKSKKSSASRAGA